MCQLEHQLFDNFFPEADAAAAALQGGASSGGGGVGAGAGGDAAPLAPLMDPLCTVLYDALRPAFIQLQSLDDLCALVDILQHEVRGWLRLWLALGRAGNPVGAKHAQLPCPPIPVWSMTAYWWSFSCVTVVTLRSA